jgi:hypothetical protein
VNPKANRLPQDIRDRITDPPHQFSLPDSLPRPTETPTPPHPPLNPPLRSSNPTPTPHPLRPAVHPLTLPTPNSINLSLDLGHPPPLPLRAQAAEVPQVRTLRARMGMIRKGRIKVVRKREEGILDRRMRWRGRMMTSWKGCWVGSSC